jgi:hypothetical protein
MAKQNFVLHQAGFYGLNQSKALAARLLSTGMMKERPQNEIGRCCAETRIS